MQTYEEILAEMLAKVPDDLDKREGSLIYTALAPTAAMIAEQQFYDDQVIDATMPDTAVGAYQTLLYSDFGVDREQAAAAQRRGIFVPDEAVIGSRFGAGGVAYTVVSKLTDASGGYLLQCEQAGEVGNRYFGAVLPLDNLNPNLESAQLGEILVSGEDEEDDETYRQRFYAEMRSQAFGGNVAQYQAQIKAIPGVGDVEVFPTPGNEGGCVACVIVDPYNKPASATLVAAVQELIDPPPQGKGYGLAPVDHMVTISTPASLSIAVAATVTVDSGYDLSSLQAGIQEAVAAYLDTLGMRGDTVRCAHVETAILSVDGIIDVTSVTLNGADSNVTLTKTFDAYQLPVLGDVTLQEGS